MPATKTYKFRWNFGSGHGTWAAGDVATFDDETAEHINRESPGVLAEEGEDDEEAGEDDAGAETRQLAAPPADRQVKAAPRKRAT